MRLILLMLATVITLLGASQSISTSEREVLLRQVKETKKLQRQKLKQHFKKIQAARAHKKMKRKLRKSRFRQQIKHNRIKQKIRRQGVSP